MDLGISASLVQAQRASTPSTSAPKPARMATIKMLGDMEKCVAFAPSNVLRCWAGAFAALGHGVLRWSDLQHSEGVKLTEDAVFGVTWRMKGKHVKSPWAALRRGFLNKDWGSSWLAELAKNELPGKDFVLRAPKFHVDGLPRSYRRLPRCPGGSSSVARSHGAEPPGGHVILMPLVAAPVPYSWQAVGPQPRQHRQHGSMAVGLWHGRTV